MASSPALLPSGSDETTEYTPLLRQTPQQRPTWKQRLLPQWTWKKWQVMLITGEILLVNNSGSTLGTAPQVRIFEEVACRQYKRSIGLVGSNSTISLNGDICKSAPVQSEVAMVTGWKNTLDLLPAVALGLPYGVIADRVGRRPISILALSSIALSEIVPRVVCWFDWPLRLVWITGFVRAPGGGDLVATTMLLTIVADTFEADERAPALFRLASLTLLAEIISAPISASAMNIDPWIPYFLGLAAFIVSVLIAFLLPETLDEAKAKRPERSDSEDPSESLQPPTAAKDTVLNTIITQAQDFIRSTRHMWRNANILMLLFMVFVGAMDRSYLSLLVQYASAKLHWSISEASYLISIRGCTSLAAFLLLIPSLSTFLTRKLHYRAVEKDLCLSRVAAVFGIFGYLMLFLAPTPALVIIGIMFMSLSQPFVVAVMSVATSFVSPEHVATLYSAMSVTQSLGVIVAGPTFAKLYEVGMQLGLEWSGLPFAVGSLIFIVVLIPLICLRPARLET